MINAVSNFNAQLRRELRSLEIGQAWHESFARRKLTAYVLGLSGRGLLQPRSTLMRGLEGYPNSDAIIHHNTGGLYDSRGGSRILQDTYPKQFGMGTEAAYFAYRTRMSCEQTELTLRHLMRNLEATGQNTRLAYKRLTILSRRYTMLYGSK